MPKQMPDNLELRPNDDDREALQRILTHWLHALTDWELSLINSLESKVAHAQLWSLAQAKAFDSIWEEVSSGRIGAREDLL